MRQDLKNPNHTHLPHMATGSLMRVAWLHVEDGLVLGERGRSSRTV